MTAPPSLHEARRLIRALDELETATLVDATRPATSRVSRAPATIAADQSDISPRAAGAPRMQAMVRAVYSDYRRTLTGATESVLPAAESASFADLSDRARRLRGRTSELVGAAPTVMVPRAAPPPRNVEPDVVERIARYSDDLHQIVEHAGGSTGDNQRGFTRGSPPGDVPTVRARSLSPPDARRIRLAHELGVTPVAAWTLVTVSGDMASAFSQVGDATLVQFHGALATEGLLYWRGLITNVVQLMSTLLGLVFGIVFIRSRPDIPSWKELRDRLRRALKVSPSWLYRETQELIGQGGKVFETGPNGELRSLLQPDGTIITHAAPGALADLAVTKRHTSDIAAWLRRLLEGWEAANDILQLVAVVVLIVVAGAQFAGQGWADLWQGLLHLATATLAALVTRAAIAAVIRYAIFRAH